MKYSTGPIKRAAMLTLGAAIPLLPFTLVAQTASPSPATTAVEEKEHHDYGWVGLLGLLGLAGLARRKPTVNVAERTTAPRS
jgi:MYXO-CTERM domain-containing protein